MKLWILKLKDNQRWEVMAAAVVRAVDEVEARLLASRKAGQEGRAAWINPDESTCELLIPEGDAGVMVAAYHS